MHINFYRDRLSKLKKKGFNPRVIYDIGAGRGEWSLETSEVFSQADFYLFEANEANREALQKQPFPYFLELLGDEEREAAFYCDGQQGTLWPASKLRRCSLKMGTLSSSVRSHRLPLPNLVKIDAQDSECLIVRGGEEVIRNAEALIVRTKIHAKKAPLVHEMFALMDSLGHRVFDLLGWRYLNSGELNEIDYLFLLKDSELFID